jgi:hypothetical protein
MCGACGTRVVAAPWEDVLAGAGPAQRSARAAAANRLLADRRVRVSTWRGGYLLTAATGAARPVASLDELWDAVGRPPSPAGPEDGGQEQWAWGSPPAGWDLQAGIVWTSQAGRVGGVTAAVLPRGNAAGPITVGRPTRPACPPSPEAVGVLGPHPGAALDRLIAFLRRDPPA